MSGQAAQSFGAGAPAVGDVLAQKYRVESMVGRGGMGVVLSARHVQLGQVVAIKLLTLPPDEDRRDEAIGRFLHEAQAAAKLQNDHVVRIYDVGQLDNGLPFMVMELLVGADLGTVLDERGALTEPEAVDYVLQACAGVAEAHRMGIVHRDLKPSNLFVTKRSDGLPLLKVLDFGISKQLTDPASGEAVPTFTNTRTLMGSPHYMSPEQVRDARRVDGRTDIWALGVILQELITDAPVFHGESFPGVCAAIVADPPMPVRTMRPDVSAALEAIIGRCLEKDAKLRFQSVAELQAALMPLAPQILRSGSISQPVAYSSGTREVASPIRVSPSAKPGDPTVASGPPEKARSGPDRTLESARLATGQGSTQSALASTDPRVPVVEATLSPPARSKARLLLPLGLAALLGAAGLWLQSHPSPAPTVASSEASASLAPAPPSSFTLSIDSDPSGASVTEGSTPLGTTPFSLTLSMPAQAGPRVFVVEKDGYLPYVVRQGAARGEVRVMAALTPRVEEPKPATSAAPSALPVSKAPPPAARIQQKPAKKPSAPAATPPSDIRLER
jgi:eukaryotic-like serine/threonine-protein kinase